MRIIQINSVYGSGSTGRIVADIHAMLQKKGEDSSVFFGRGECTEKKVQKVTNLKRVLVDVFFTRATGDIGCFSRKAARRLCDEIERTRPDVVHLHNLHGYYIHIYELLEFLKKTGIRTILTLHDEFLYTGKCAYANTCDKWKIGCGYCARIHEYPSSLLFDKSRKLYFIKKNLFANWDKVEIVVPSKFVYDRVKESFLSDKACHIIHNGVNADSIFSPQKVTKEELGIGRCDDKVILAVAPDLMSRRKGGDYLIELAKSMQATGFKFILIGAGRWNGRVPANVSMISSISNPHVLAKYYSASDFFVLSSEVETFSMTCAESLCCGTPVVGFACGGPETVFAEPYASFVDHGDVGALRETILSRLDMYPQRASVSGYGKREFSSEVMVGKYYDVYARMTNNETWNENHGL
jgi:glycosyltransferase involved in cell wall biosynthesis